MSKFPMDLSKFKKVSSDDKASTLRHKDGHELRIAHSKLSPALKAKLEKLPMVDSESLQSFADGGMAESPLDINLASNMAAPSLPQSSLAEELGINIPQGMSAADFLSQQVAQRGIAPIQMPTTQRRPAEFPVSAGDQRPAPISFMMQPLQAQMGALEKQRAGEEMIARAQGAAAGAESERLAEFTEQMQNSAKQYQEQYDKLGAERQAMMRDIQNGHINPNDYIQRMSTGDKIMTGIGLILGGMGAGLTRGPNMASDFLDQQINRDIDAQKTELGKKQNLLSHNFQQTQDLRQAEQMTRMQLNDILSAQLKAEATKAQSNQTKGLLMTIAGKYDLENAKIQQQMALHQAAMGAPQGPDPAKLVPLLVPKEAQKEVFHEIEQAEHSKKMHKEVMNLFDKAADEVTGFGRVTSAVKEPRELNAIRQLMMPILRDLEGQVNETEIQMMKANLPNNRDTEEDIQTKRNALEKFILSKQLGQTARGYGIDLQRFPTTAAPKPREAREGQIAEHPKFGRVIYKDGKYIKQ